MKRDLPSTVKVFCLVFCTVAHVVPCQAIWDVRDLNSVAENAPVIVTGEITRVDVAAPGDRVVDVAHIRILRVDKNQLSDAPLKAGGEILAWMHGKNCFTTVSTDLRYEPGTKAIWLVFLEELTN